MYHIYAIVNKENNKIYIGQTKQGYLKRFIQHKCPRSGCPLLKNAINKYGKENFVCELLDFAENQEEANRKEIMWIALLKTFQRQNGYNLSMGGSFGNFNKETLKKMSNKKKGKLNNFYNKKHTEESKKKMSEWKKQNYILEKHPGAKKIKCVELNKIYDCVKLAEKELGINAHHIGQVANCQKGRKTAGRKHRLMVGDATSWKDVDKLMGGEIADLVVTDPPYNVDITGSDNKKILNDNMTDSDFEEFLLGAFQNLYERLKEGGAFYVWHASRTQREFENALNRAGLYVREQLIWNKNSLVLGRSDYQWKHEPCLYGWKEGSHYFIDDRTQTTVQELEQTDIKKLKKEDLIKLLEEIMSYETTVINEAKPQRNADHPTMKPIRLIGRLVKNSSKKGEKVLDLFGGSGSTLIACEELGRVCYINELDPRYADCILDRFEKMTGIKPEKIG